jgi:hypothetical protein
MSRELESFSLPDHDNGSGVDNDLFSNEPMEVSLVDDGLDNEPLTFAKPEGHRAQNDQQGYEHLDGQGQDEKADWQEQVDRERRLRTDAERRNAAERDQVEQALLNSEKQKIRIQHDAFKLSLDSVDVRLRTATEALKMARVDQDISSSVELEDQIAQLRQIRQGIERNMGQLPNEQDLDRAYQEHVRTRQSRSPSQDTGAGSDGVRPLNDKAGQWTRANNWMNDPQRAPEKAALIAINDQLVKEGYDANDTRFFDELTKRMAKTFPSLGVSDLHGRKLGGAPATQGQRPRQAAAPPVAGGRSVAPPTPRAQNRIRVDVDGSDRRMLRTLGIDLADKKAVERYAREKLNRIRSEQAGR